jgi:hypothetical protein
MGPQEAALFPVKASPMPVTTRYSYESAGIYGFWA